MKENTIVSNFLFDRIFLDTIKKSEKRLHKVINANGVPLHFINVFKIISILEEDNLNTKTIALKFSEIYGVSIMQSSLSRSLKYLAGQLKLVDYANNPFNEKYTWVQLTTAGKKLKKIFLADYSDNGNSNNPDYKHIKLRVVK